MNSIARAKELNAVPLDHCLDREQVASILSERELIFSDTRIFVASGHLQQMANFVAVMEQVTALPGWCERVLRDAPLTSLHTSKAKGVCFGYDFHISDEGPKLIEINTNAGGAFLNLALLKAQRELAVDVVAIEKTIVDMFIAEGKPKSVAIVDNQPSSQYLYPDFEMCRDLLEKHGIAAQICDPSELRDDGGRLMQDDREIDLVYNRLTDFYLDEPDHAVLREAWLSGAAVITPNPQNYALFANKRHLSLLSDDEWLASIRVDAATRHLIAAIVPRTECVNADNAEDIRARRKKLFFKPATGYGSKATYRGQNVTTRVFEEILKGDYVAQTLVTPPSRRVNVGGAVLDLKYDLRCYAYAGKVQLTAARLWQGQTTNFRTPGGGFTPVVSV